MWNLPTLLKIMETANFAQKIMEIANLLIMEYDNFSKVQVME